MGAGAEAGAGVVVLAGHQFSLGPGTDSTDRAPLIPLHSSLDSLEGEKKKKQSHHHPKNITFSHI